MATTNFHIVRQRVTQELSRWGLSIVRTATGGAVGSVTDSSLALSGASADRFDHHWLKIATTTDGLAPQGEVRQVTEGGFTPASGALAVPSNFSVAPGSGDTFEVHEFFDPPTLDGISNKLTRNLFIPTIFPLSAHIVTADDNDMEGSGTTSFDATNSTMAKNTATIFGGNRSLAVTATAAGGYAVPDTNFQIPAPARQFYTAVSIAVTDGDEGQLILIDVTNSNAEIESSAEVTLTAWHELIIPWTAPSGCRQMQPRLVSVNNTDVTYWEDYQTWVSGRHIYALPSWITSKQQVTDVRAFPTGSTIADDDYETNYGASYALPWKFEREDWFAGSRIYISVGAGAERPFIFARRPIPAVSYDFGTDGTGTTANTVPLATEEADMLVQGVLAECYGRLSSGSAGAEKTGFLIDQARAMREWNRLLVKRGLGEPVRSYDARRLYGTIGQ